MIRNLLATGLFALMQAPPPALVIDGELDDPLWRTVAAEKLSPSEAGVPADTGGEIRATILGRYLCISARLPEPGGRITARMIGRNPNWEDEDLLRIVAGPDIGYTDREVKINPLGAYSVERSGAYVQPWADQYLVATHIGENEWTVEIAFPLNLVGAPGPDRILVSVERIRAARPGAPQQRWHWPQYGPVAKVSVASRDWNLPAPQFRPAVLGNGKPPVEIGRVETLPPLERAWSDAAWAKVTARPLLRDEPAPRLPRFPSEVKMLHDGRTLALLARCAEPAGPAPQDSLRVYLATSGSAYAQIAVDRSGLRRDAAGVTGGSRISRPRDWDSGARSLVRETADGWVVRLDIPLERVAEVLGESSVPRQWRLLVMRSRPAQGGEPPETSVLPVIQSDTPLCPARYQPLVLAGRMAGPGAPEHRTPPFDTRVFSAEQRRETNLAGMLQRHLRDKVQKIVQEEDELWSRIRTREEWERYRDPRIKALAASLGPFPERSPLQIRVIKEYAGAGYRRQDLVYRSRPGLWVTANLYLPEKPAARMPGIMIIHSHHRPRTQAELQDMGILWARVGCAVLIMDQIGHGERIQYYPWNREPYHSRYMMGMQLYVAGESLIKWIVWDVMRGIDLMLERKDVDPEKIILLGAVAGGGDPAAVTAALDSRVAAVAPFNFVRTGAGWGEWESTRCLRRSISDRFFAWVIDASVAPRRLIYANEMGWENYRRHDAWERYQRVFAFYGVPERLDEAHGFGTFPGPGECTNIGPFQRKTMYPELNRWFGIPIPPEEPNDRRPEAELASLTPATAAELRMKPLHQLAGEIARAKVKAARAELQRLSPGERRKWLQEKWAEKLGDIQANPRPEAIARWNKQWKNSGVEAFTLEVEPGILVLALLLKPAGSAQARVPVVVALSQGGKERILGLREEEIDNLLRAEVAVCLPDVRGTGETLSDPRRGLSSEGNSLAATEFMLGNTLLGARLKDVRSVIAYLKGRRDVDPARIALWGDSYAPPNPPRLLIDEVPGWQIGPAVQQQAEPLGALLALLGALYEDVRAVAARGGLAGYESILDDNFTYVPSDIIVPGILEAGDIADVAGALPHPVLLEALVDGRNRLAPEASLVNAYGSSRHMVIRTGDRAPHLADWLALQLRQRQP